MTGAHRHPPLSTARTVRPLRALVPLALLLPLSALAQQTARGVHAADPPASTQAVGSTAIGSPARDPHAGHDPGPPKPDTGASATDPHAGHAQGMAPAPSASQATGATPGMPDMRPAASAGPVDGPAPVSPAPPRPPTQAELDAAFPDLHGMAMQDHMDDDPVLGTLLVDRLERQDGGRQGSASTWEVLGWTGDLQNRLWLRSEGERRDGRIEQGDVELLWGRPTGPWWDALLGVRRDLGPGPGRDWLAVGVQGGSAEIRVKMTRRIRISP